MKRVAPDPKIEIFQSDDDNWYYHLKGSNGKIMIQSEGYATKRNAKRAVERLLEIFEGYVDTVVIE